MHRLCCTLAIHLKDQIASCSLRETREKPESFYKHIQGCRTAQMYQLYAAPPKEYVLFFPYSPFRPHQVLTQQLQMTITRSHGAILRRFSRSRVSPVPIAQKHASLPTHRADVKPHTENCGCKSTGQLRAMYICVVQGNAVTPQVATLSWVWAHVAVFSAPTLSSPCLLGRQEKF